jgi:hypothetical protein
MWLFVEIFIAIIHLQLKEFQMVYVLLVEQEPQVLNQYKTEIIRLNNKYFKVMEL